MSAASGSAAAASRSSRALVKKPAVAATHAAAAVVSAGAASGAGGGLRSRRVPSVRQGPWPAASNVARLQDLSAPHVESFNYFLGDGLQAAVADLPAREVTVAGDTMQFWLEDVSVGQPLKNDASAADPRLLPSECRERGLTYAAAMHGTVVRRINGGPVEKLRVKLGEVPIMVRSTHCHTHGMNPKELVEIGEEAVEFGGYFICNGNERIVRMLQIPKRNYPHAITRSAYTNRGPLYSNKGVVMRCVKPDQSGVTITLHYLTDGSATVRFALNRQEFFLPVIVVLKALVATTDREIYERVLAGDTGNTYLSDRVLMLLRDAKRYAAALHSRDAALSYLGARFRGILDMPASLSDVEAGKQLLDRFILVHLPREAYRDKFNTLVLMLRKLYAFVRGDVTEDNPDALANHELLLTGHLLLMATKEKLSDYLQGIEEMIRKEEQIATRLAAKGVTSGPGSTMPNIADGAYLKRVVDRQPEVGRKLSYLLATGNLVTKTGLDLMQVSGYSVVADKINFMRFTTHFRSVHRGQFFAEQKTTTVRKLLPENWGFLCPIHTPDGGPCGLLNHLAGPCTVVAHPLSEADYAAAVGEVAARAETLAATSGVETPRVSSSERLLQGVLDYLVSLGMVPFTATQTVMPANHLPIMMDGRVLGGAPPHATYHISRALRAAKACTTGLRAGIDRVPGAPVPGDQQDAVEQVLRGAVRGLTRIAPSTRWASAPHHDAKDTSYVSSLVAPPPVALPPSMEVAFIPPPWWDADVDPHKDPASVATGGASGAAAGAATGGAGSDSDDDDDALVGDGAQAAAAARIEGGGDSSSGSGGGGSTSKAGGDDKLVGLFPGLFLFTSPARMVRPVIQLDTGLIELVCPQEQPYLDIACTPEDVTDILHMPVPLTPEQQRRLLYTHIELGPTSMLSEVASLTPFSDLNQSPRNMYQCQMGKQTMGTPIHSWPHRADTKLFRLQNPQAPLVQAAAQSTFAMDEYPSGCNAVVAVIAYTGYDMEDACIVNKSSYERGFGHASVYKTLVFDLNEGRPASDAGRFQFHNGYLKGEQAYRDPTIKPAAAELVGGAAAAASAAAALGPGGRPKAGQKIAPHLDEDGLPPVGTLLRHEDPIYVVLDTVTGTHKIARHKDLEPAYVDEVRILGPGSGGKVTSGATRVSVKLRINRNPVVGDKFSSRHGQKGVLSYLWPQSDMPFTESGMSPDVIINPHAFPSRMTIGMLVESMAGKAGACHGTFQDATPFRFDEGHRVVDYFGQQLREAGYSYYGTETMYSGVTGEPMHCEIYLGVVYYQRLRHMVNDKSQVRATGPINQLTRQPVKGRKKHGGIRFGEMERDSLLAHGASFLLHDRLHNSSDRHLALVCRGCGSMVSTFSTPAQATVKEMAPDAAFGGAGGVTTHALALGGAAGGMDGAAAAALAASRAGKARRAPMCLSCGTGDHCVAVPMPYVFRYLAAELAAMGIKLKLEMGTGPYAAVAGPALPATTTSDDETSGVA